MLGKLQVPGRPTNLDYSRARALFACSRCELGLFGNSSLIYHFSFLSPSLWKTEILPQRAVKPTNQLTITLCSTVCVPATPHRVFDVGISNLLNSSGMH